MTGKNSLRCKIVLYTTIGVLTISLFFVSLSIDYQYEMIKEHVRFRPGFLSQINWISSPYGTLKCYLFNVTNSNEFLKGIDKKLKLQEVGPIVYRIKGRNDILNQTHSNLIYKKIRYDKIEFDPFSSISPDILNKTIILPNLILLGSAAKLHDWVFLVRHAFNAIVINEPAFIERSVFYFLWDFTTPTLDLLSSYIPNIVANCGILYNALRQKDEIYTVKIGLQKNEIENFFHVNYLNNKTYFSEHHNRLKYLNNKDNNIYCPIDISESLDNSIFPPFIKSNDNLTIIAGESCRTFKMQFTGVDNHLGFIGYRYIINDNISISNCLDSSMGIQLPRGIFDTSKCLFNDVPSAFSAPHFYGSSYNWSEHIEGLLPNENDHLTSIVIEPITGIPIEEKYRFQSNIPMPNMLGYNKDLQHFSNMIVPTFWYEYDLDDLPLFVVFLMKIQVFLAPIIQPILMAFCIFTVSICYLNISLLIYNNKNKNLSITLEQLRTQRNKNEK